jgi:hypothetical protein
VIAARAKTFGCGEIPGQARDDEQAAGYDERAAGYDEQAAGYDEQAAGYDGYTAH